jgi:tetratricopeptide (TPR) repeat protein
MNSTVISESETQLTYKIGHLERLDELNKLFSLVKTTDFLRAEKLGRELVSIAIHLNNPAQLAQAYYDLGNVLWKLGESEDAQLNFKLGLDIYLELADNNGIADSYCGLGIVHGSVADWANALKYFEKGKTAAKRANNHVKLAHLFGNIGHIYFGIEKQETAQEYFEEALQISEELGDRGQQGVANMLDALAGVHVHQNKFDEAIEKLERALAIHYEIGHFKGVANALTNLGITYHKAGQHANALTYFNKSLAYSEKTNLLALKPEIHKYLSDLYFDINDNAEALRHLQCYSDFQKAEKRNGVQRNSKSIV